MKRLLAEPLLHFALLGGAVFAVEHFRRSAPETPAPAATTAAPAIDRTIVVETAQVTAQATRRLGHAPSPAELEAELQRVADEEILFREAIARGLERDDPMIHERIAARMSYVLAEGAIVPEPTDAQLRAWFDAHADRYAEPLRVDFTHVFAGAQQENAEILAARIANKEPPEALGQPFAGGRKYRGRKLADLTEAFGPEFVEGLTDQRPGVWVQRRSRHGYHVVRLDQVTPARGADFETAKLEVKREWTEAQRQTASEAALVKLRAGWKVERK